MPITFWQPGTRAAEYYLKVHVPQSLTQLQYYLNLCLRDRCLTLSGAPTLRDMDTQGPLSGAGLLSAVVSEYILTTTSVPPPK